MKIFGAAALFLSARYVFGEAASRHLATAASCDAVTSCENDTFLCNTFNGHKYWSVHTMTSNDCLTRCVDGRDLAYMKSIGYSCGACPKAKCDWVHQCQDGSNMFRLEDGRCKDECVKKDEVEKMLRDKKPWSCGKCNEPIKIKTRSGAKKIDCSKWAKADPNLPPECAADQRPPTPDNCIYKDALKALQYKPNWVAQEQGVYIEIQVSTGTIYKYGNVTGAVAPIPKASVAEFPIGNEQVLQEIKKGIKMRFVSPRGPGGWNTCKYDPIAFDLDKNGHIEILRGLNFQMDITGDGVTEELHEWFGPKEGIFVFLGEMLSNAAISTPIAISGKELMGDMGGQYSDGYDKLEEYDEDKNTKLEGQELRGFYLWVDVNSNYKLDQGELHGLEEYGIIGVSTVHVDNKSKAFLTDGTEMLTENLWFSRR